MGGKTKKLEWELDRGATLTERDCALFVDETKKNELSDLKALERARRIEGWEAFLG